MKTLLISLIFMAYASLGYSQGLVFEGIDRDIPEIRDIELKIQAMEDYKSVLVYAISDPDAFAKSCLKGINNPDRPTIGYWEALALSYIIDSNLINQSIRDDIISSSLQALKKADKGRNVFIAAKDILSREQPYPVDPMIQAVTSVMDIVNESDMNECFAGNILILLGGMGKAVSASNLKVDVVDVLEVISSDFVSPLFPASTSALARIPGNEASDALRRILIDHPSFNDGVTSLCIIDTDAGDRDVFDLRQAELVALLFKRGDTETVGEFSSSGKGGKLAQNVAAKYLDKPLPHPNYEVSKGIGDIASTVGNIGILLVTGHGPAPGFNVTLAAKSGVATKSATKLMTAIKSDALVPVTTFNIASKESLVLKAAPMVGALNIAKQTTIEEMKKCIFPPNLKMSQLKESGIYTRNLLDKSGVEYWRLDNLRLTSYEDYFRRRFNGKVRFSPNFKPRHELYLYQINKGGKLGTGYAEPLENMLRHPYTPRYLDLITKNDHMLVIDSSLPVSYAGGVYNGEFRFIALCPDAKFHHLVHEASHMEYRLAIEALDNLVAEFNAKFGSTALSREEALVDLDSLFDFEGFEAEERKLKELIAKHPILEEISKYMLETGLSSEPAMAIDELIASGRQLEILDKAGLSETALYYSTREYALMQMLYEIGNMEELMFGKLTKTYQETIKELKLIREKMGGN